MTSRLSLVCPPCGQVIEADSEDQLVELGTAHAKTKHGATVGRAEILKRARAGPVNAGTAILPRPLHSHTTLESTDIEKSVRFYREVLGLSTARQLDSVGLLHASNGHIAAIIELPKVAPQPYWNYYARAVPRERVDELHDAVARVAADYEIAELRDPEIEGRFGVGSYGFALRDRDGNWWRIEEAVGPFGTATLPQVEGTSIIPPGPIPYVTLESEDLTQSAAFYETFLGLDVAVRDGAIHSQGRGGVNLIVVPAQDGILPQPVLNHHGLTFPQTESALVDFAHRALTDERERFGIRKILKVTSQHGSYSFYFQDRDTNWWEVETLKDGFNPWQRVSHPPGSEHLLKQDRGANTIVHPFRV